jgi:Family of unknown function (DUF6279)
MLRRQVLLLPLLAGLASCSSLQSGYRQLPFLAGWWINSYLDLDRAQQQQLDAALKAWHGWHRLEELPRWQALLSQADQALLRGFAQADLNRFEAAGKASLVRSLEHAASLAPGLLASLQPAQWQRLQDRMEQRLRKWQEEQQSETASQERGKAFVRTLQRWLGPLDAPTRELAQSQAQAWRRDSQALARARTARQAAGLRLLRALAQGEPVSVAALLHNTEAERAQSEQVKASVLGLLAAMDAAQKSAVSRHWMALQAELQALR